MSSFAVIVLILAVPPSGLSQCGDCGEDCDSPGRTYHLTDPVFLFDTIAGDELLLNWLRNRESADLTFSAGGELRYRHMNERNRLRPGGPGQSAYELWRFTPYVEMNYKGFIGGYVQAIDASMFGLDAPYSPTAIDVNRADLLQVYAELHLGEIADGNLSYRFGRQFLQYGGQRLLSSLAWANTYRNFEGHKFIYVSDDWNIDAFAMQSLNAAAGNVSRPRSFDQAAQSRWIGGVYATWKGIEHNDVDLYYIYFDESDASPNFMDGQRHTIGARLAGKQSVHDGETAVGTWSWDVEGAWQFGRDNFGSASLRTVNAGMFGALAGYSFENAAWKPGIGAIFYWGSGDNDPTTGNIRTFTTMYPLGHAHWGLIDNFAGQNLLNYGVQASVKPHEKLSIASQWHYFDLARPADRIYNIAGAALPGSGDRHLGSELDLVGTYAWSRSFSVQLGYMWFFYGDAINNGGLARSDAEQLYLQVTYNF